VISAVILLMQQDGLDEEGAYSQLRRGSMRARQNLELYCEEFLSRRAKPPDISRCTTSITLQGGNKQAI
jgi:ANTAR domain-containing protein